MFPSSYHYIIYMERFILDDIAFESMIRKFYYMIIKFNYFVTQVMVVSCLCQCEKKNLRLTNTRLVIKSTT